MKKVTYWDPMKGTGLSKEERDPRRIELAKQRIGWEDKGEENEQ